MDDKLYDDLENSIRAIFEQFRDISDGTLNAVVAQATDAAFEATPEHIRKMYQAQPPTPRPLSNHQGA